MKKIFLSSIITSIIFISGCQKEEISFGTNVNDVFFVDNERAGMKVTVRGNTLSKVILLIVHGGPGSNSSFYAMPKVTDKYSVAFWDQRIAGASQGGANAPSINLETYTTDMKKVILTLKHRYGQDFSIFVFGHSWGGLLSSSFVTTSNNQQLLNGWIYAAGVHNMPLLNNLLKDKLIAAGLSKIAANDNVADWQIVVNYCNSLTGVITDEQALTLYDFGSFAEEEYTKNIIPDASQKDYSNTPPFIPTPTFFNQINPLNRRLLDDQASLNLTPKLQIVNIPTLVMSGNFDFTCPSGLGDDLYSNISSPTKTNITLNNSGHLLQQWDLSIDEILKFIDSNK